MFNSRLSKTQLYWFLQFSGWTAWFIMVGLIYIQRGVYHYKLWLNLCLNVLLYIVVTHLYRWVVIKFNWLRMPLLRLLFISFWVSWLFAIPLAIINIPLDHWTLAFMSDVVDLANLYDYSVHIVRSLVPWMTIYIFLCIPGKMETNRNRKIPVTGQPERRSVALPEEPGKSAFFV